MSDQTTEQSETCGSAATHLLGFSELQSAANRLLKLKTGIAMSVQDAGDRVTDGIRLAEFFVDCSQHRSLSQKLVMLVGQCIAYERDGYDALASSVWDQIHEAWFAAEQSA